ncbi:NifB/NifX family molybdenum-iron cluster-binding protein [Nitrincola alkalisediminis]|uniref:NifB/NifX family molybdenum-iron cluster-binding protein n=1 Tax=Nitrincola alkalisediminis TaxID=1366656 RepID=UPI001876F778|nr:NifB/NifX family molybdenum-iron cluster-binding protein [Nitrincola alkalisediminis]
MRHLKLIDSAKSDTRRLHIAFASSDRCHVNQHFGAAEAFVIYSISAVEYRVAEIAEFSGNDTLKDQQEGKLDAKVKLLQGCAAVYCNAVGASAIRQLLAAGVQPLKVEQGVLIEDLLKQLIESWPLSAPVWLTRALRQQENAVPSDECFTAMLAEGWTEDGPSC